jgi:hypothetical protein
MTYIWTKSGRKFYFDDVSKNKGKLKVSDIAWGLSNLCRYNGQCRKFYSIAEPSIWVSKLVRPELALTGLLHDGSEAFMADITRPLKRLLPDYKAKELEVETFFASELKLTFPYPLEIHQIDYDMLRCEFNQLFSVKEFDNPFPDLKLNFWKPHKAYREFMSRYNELKNAKS